MMVTYLGHSKEMINEAQSILMQCFHSDAFVQRLAVLICNPNEESTQLLMKSILRRLLQVCSKITHSTSHKRKEKNSLLWKPSSI